MRLLFYIILLGLAAWCGVILRNDPGYMFFSHQGWSIEMPMWLAETIILLSFCVLLMGYHFFSSLLNSFHEGKIYLQNARGRTARQQTTQALLQSVQAQWIEAEKNAIKGATYSDVPFINYLLAAKAAQEQNAWVRRDRYLQLAAKSTVGAGIAAGLTKAQLQFQQGEVEQSLATLNELKDVTPKHPLVLKLLGMLYKKEKNWQQLLNILPRMKKNKALASEELCALEEDTYKAILQETVKQHKIKELITAWQAMPKSIKQNPRLIATYATCLQSLDAHKEAEQILSKAIKKGWNKELVRRYGFIHGENLTKQITIAETWLQEHPHDAILLLTLARLCLRSKLWGKARDYLEASLQLEANPETYAELGRLLGYLGEPEKCRDCYKKGLFAATDVLDIEHDHKPGDLILS